MTIHMDSKQFPKKILLHNGHLVLMLCCLCLFIPYIVFGSMNPQKSCSDDGYYSPYVTIYKKIGGKKVKSIPKGGFMDTTQLCDKLICLNGPVMIYENAVDTGDGKVSRYYDGDALHLRKRQINVTCVPGLNGIPPGFDCNSMGSGSGVHSAANDAGGVGVTPAVDPMNPTLDSSTTETATTVATTEMTTLTTSMTPTSTMVPGSHSTSDATTTTADPSGGGGGGGGGGGDDGGGGAFDESTTTGDYAFVTTDPTAPEPTVPVTHETVWKPCIFKQARLEVFDHKCFKLNQLPKKTKLNNRVSTGRLVTNAGGGGGGGGGGDGSGGGGGDGGGGGGGGGVGAGSCNMHNVIGRKIYGIKMLTSLDDYRLAHLTQFEHPRFEIQTENDCGPINSTSNDIVGHSFAVIGNTDQFDFCYSKKSKKEDLFVRLHMQSIPVSPTICLYEPGGNDGTDDFFDGKKKKDFKWTKCDSKWSKDMTTPGPFKFRDHDLFAINNPYPKGVGRSGTFNPFAWTSDMFTNTKANAKSRTTQKPKVVTERKNGKVSHASHAILSSNCTTLPVLDTIKCSGRKKTKNVCEFMERSLGLADINEDEHLKARRRTMELVDNIFEKICVQVSSHLPTVARNLVMFYLEKVVNGGGTLPVMKNDTWKFLIQDLETCFEQAEPMQFIMDEDFGDGEPWDEEEESSEEDIIGKAAARNRLPSFQSLDLTDYYDYDGNLTTTRRKKFVDNFLYPLKRYAKAARSSTSDWENMYSKSAWIDPGDDIDRQRRQDPTTPDPSPSAVTTDATTATGGSGKAVGRAGAPPPAPKKRDLPRPIQEVDKDAKSATIPVMPTNVQVVHQLASSRKGKVRRRRAKIAKMRRRRTVATDSGVKLYYYEEAAELEYEFNVALDAHWKIFSTVLGYCNKFYKARKAETFPRLYNSYFDDILEPIEDAWLSSSDNEELDVIVSEFSDPVTTEWLNSCLEASYIVSDSITFRPPRPLTFNEGADLVTNYFEEVPAPEFFVPESMRTAIARGYQFEANAVDSETGTLNRKLVGIPADPGCHWSCDEKDECHKVCGASEKEKDDTKSFHILHGPDGETSIIPNEVVPEEEEAEVSSTPGDVISDDGDSTADGSVPQPVLPEKDAHPVITSGENTPKDYTPGGNVSEDKSDENNSEDGDSDGTILPDKDHKDPASDTDSEARLSRKVGRTLHEGKQDSSKPNISNTEKLARKMEAIDENEDKNANKTKSFWHTGTVRKHGRHQDNKKHVGRTAGNRKGGKEFWNAGRSNHFHQPETPKKETKLVDNAKSLGRNLVAIKPKDSRTTETKPAGRNLKDIKGNDSKATETKSAGRNLKEGNGKNSKITENNKPAGRNLKDIKSKDSKLSENKSAGRSLNSVKVKESKTAGNKAMGRGLTGSIDEQKQMEDAFKMYYGKKQRKAKKKAKDAVHAPALGRNVPTFDESRLKILFTTQSPTKLVGATTMRATTTTTPAPPVATPPPGPRKVGTGRRMPHLNKLGRNMGMGKPPFSYMAKGRAALIHHYSHNKTADDH